MSNVDVIELEWKELAEEVRIARRVLEKVAFILATVTPEALETQTHLQKKICVDLIKSIVAHEYEITLDVMMGRLRTEEVAWARQVAMALSREFTSLPLQSLGKLFDRDHGTIMHAIEHVEGRCQTNRNIATRVEYIRTLIREKII